MQALSRAAKAAVQASTRGFAAGAYPDRKVAVLGAAGECTCVPGGVRPAHPHVGHLARALETPGRDLGGRCSRDPASPASVAPCGRRCPRDGRRRARRATATFLPDTLPLPWPPHVCPCAGGIGQPLSLLMKVRRRSAVLQGRRWAVGSGGTVNCPTSDRPTAPLHTRTPPPWCRCSCHPMSASLHCTISPAPPAWRRT